jgi:hypothetical protein
MHQARHCELCDHQTVTLKDGTICGLTDRKPDFHRTCLNIALNEKFEEKLKLSNVQYQKVLSSKTWTYAYFLVFLILSLIVMGGALYFAYYLFNLTDRVGVISVAPVVILAIGIGLLSKAFGARNNYQQDLAAALHNKEKIDHALELYNIDYSIDIQFGRKYHGTEEVYVDVKFRGR